MACCKIYLTLSALITCHVSANYEYERLKSLSPEGTLQVPWNRQYEVYESASSEILPHYNFHALSKDRPIGHFGSSSESFPVTTKKEPIEEKNLKKIPFYAFTNKDSTRYKELTPDLGIAHCQEIKVKLNGKKDEPRKGITTCYNCKDPKLNPRTNVAYIVVIQKRAHPLIRRWSVIYPRLLASDIEGSKIKIFFKHTWKCHSLDNLLKIC